MITTTDTNTHEALSAALTALNSDKPLPLSNAAREHYLHQIKTRDLFGQASLFWNEATGEFTHEGVFNQTIFLAGVTVAKIKYDENLSDDELLDVLVAKFRTTIDTQSTDLVTIHQEVINSSLNYID